MTENEDLKQKKLVRGGHRAYATKILGQAKGLLVDYKDDSEAMLLQYKATLEKRVKILEQLDEEIFGLTKAEEINAAIEEASTFVEGITEILIQIDKTISLANNGNSKSKDEHPTIVAVRNSQNWFYGHLVETHLSPIASGTPLKVRLTRIQL